MVRRGAVGDARYGPRGGGAAGRKGLGRNSRIGSCSGQRSICCELCWPGTKVLIALSRARLVQPATASTDSLVPGHRFATAAGSVRPPAPRAGMEASKNFTQISSGCTQNTQMERAVRSTEDLLAPARLRGTAVAARYICVFRVHPLLICVRFLLASYGTANRAGGMRNPTPPAGNRLCNTSETELPRPGRAGPISGQAADRGKNPAPRTGRQMATPHPSRGARSTPPNPRAEPRSGCQAVRRHHARKATPAARPG